MFKKLYIYFFFCRMGILVFRALGLWKIAEMERATALTSLIHHLSILEMVLVIYIFLFLQVSCYKRYLMAETKHATSKCSVKLTFLFYVYCRKGNSRKCDIQLWNCVTGHCQWKAHSSKPCMYLTNIASVPPGLHIGILIWLTSIVSWDQNPGVRSYNTSNGYLPNYVI